MPYDERNLPHWLPLAKVLFVTWRLNGGLAPQSIEALRKKKFLWPVYFPPTPKFDRAM
jgi:hypothetical protein